MNHHGQPKKGSFIIRSLLLAVSACPFASHADPGTPIGDPFLVGNIVGPQVARAANGNFVVVGLDATGSGNCMAQLYNADGSARSAAFVVPSYSQPADQAFYEHCGQLAMDQDGNFVISQTNEQSTEKTFSADIYVLRYDKDGNAMSNPVLAAQMTATNSMPDGLFYTHGVNGYYTYSLSMTPGGGFVVAWRNDVVDWNGRQLWTPAWFPQIIKATVTAYVRSFDSSGQPITDPVQLSKQSQTKNDLTPSLPAGIDASVESNGDVIIAWNLNSGWYGRIYDASLTPQGAQFRISAAGAASAAYCCGSEGVESKIASDVNGNFAFIWVGATLDPQNSTIDDGLPSIYLQRFNANRTRSGTPIVLYSATTLSSNFEDPSVNIAYDQTGRLAATWSVFDHNTTPSTEPLYGQYYAADGSPDGSTFTVNPLLGNGTGEQAWASAIDAAGNLVSVWDVSTRDPNTGFVSTQSFAQLTSGS